MIKVHKIRLNPTPEQEAHFRRASGTARFVYTWGLAEWKRHKAAFPGEKHGGMAIKEDFNALKGQMQYKTEWFGGKVVCVDRFFPSLQRCSVCKQLNTDLELSDREWTCAQSGTHHRRDDNAACNIEQEPLRLLGSIPVVATSGMLARGRDVRPHDAAILVEASISKRSLLST
jgi:transposase